MHQNRPLSPVVFSLLMIISALFVDHLAWAQAELTHYTIHAKLNSDQHLITATQSVKYFNDSAEPLNAIYFLLLPNYQREANPYLDPQQVDVGYPGGFEPSWLKIESAKDALGQSLNYELLEGPASFQIYSLKETLLKVSLPAPLAPGAAIEIFLEFKTKFPASTQGDEAHYRDVYAWRFGWNPVAIPAHDLIHGEYISSERPYYKLALPAALYELTLTLPKDFDAAIGADHQEIISETDEERVIEARSDAPVRSLPIAISNRFKRYVIEHNEVELAIYYLPGHEESARLFASYLTEILDAYQSRWGAYAHRRLLIIETASTDASFAGAAADAFILINQLYFSERGLGVPAFLNRLVDYLLAHEVAHQWWGIGIGVDLNAENFLSESFAQYLSITYFEQKYGEFGPNVFELESDGILERFVEHQFGYINLREHLQGELPYLNAIINRFDEAVIKPQESVKFSNFTGERVYNKGYLMLRALQGFIGMPAMDAFLKTAQERFLHGTASVEELEALAEEVSGQDLSEFFRLALYEDADGTGIAPYVDYSITDVETEFIANGRYKYKIHLFRDGQIRMPVEIVAKSQDDVLQSATWQLADQTNQEFVIELETDSAAKEIGIDPQSLTPDIDRLNNYYVLDGLSFFNRKVDLNTTGRNALPLDAYMVKINPFSQYLEGGYLLDHRWLIGNGLIGFAKNYGRGSTIRVLGAFTPAGILGELTLSKTFFSHPVTGFTGRFWEPTDQLQVSFSRQSDSSGSPFFDRRSEATGKLFNILSLIWIHQEQIAKSFAWWFRAVDDPASFVRLDGGIWQSFRVGPGISLETELTAGWGEGLTGIFRYHLGALGAYAAAPGYPFIGMAYFSGKISLNLPFQREMGYNLLNAAVLHQLDERFFVEFGNVFEDPVEIGSGLLEDLRLQIGFEASLSGRTFGGLFPWEVRIGVIYPVTNIDPDQRILRQYFEISTPFF